MLQHRMTIEKGKELTQVVVYTILTFCPHVMYKEDLLTHVGRI